MSLVIVAPNRNIDEWLKVFYEEDKSVSIQVWPEISDPLSVVGAVVWNPPRGCLKSFPNLKFISSMGAGVDHIMRDPDLPDHVSVARIVDDALTRSMSNYVIAATLFHQRNLQKYISDKANKIWDQESAPEQNISIGIMGMGVLGTDVALKLSALEFEVFGYSNSRKFVKNIKSYAGEEELPAFLKQINVLVCLLPLTNNTKNILNRALFDQVNKGTFLINAARGHHLVEGDLLEAIERGSISGAFLDVFKKEPLPEDHPFWNHPKIMLTPHIASITNPQAAVPQILKNMKAILSNQPLENKVSRDQEY